MTEGLFLAFHNPSVSLRDPPPLTQGRLSFGLAYSSPDLFVALLGFTAPPVELGVYFDHQIENGSIFIIEPFFYNVLSCVSDPAIYITTTLSYGSVYALIPHILILKIENRKTASKLML